MRLIGLICVMVFALSVQAETTVSAQAIRAHTEFLASDSLLGRNAGTNEYQVAADYVRAEFMKLGMKPGGEDGTFFQEVPLLAYSPVRGSHKTIIKTSSGDI